MVTAPIDDEPESHVLFSARMTVEADYGPVAHEALRRLFLHPHAVSPESGAFAWKNLACLESAAAQRLQAGKRARIHVEWLKFRQPTSPATVLATMRARGGRRAIAQEWLATLLIHPPLARACFSLGSAVRNADGKPILFPSCRISQEHLLRPLALALAPLDVTGANGSPFRFHPDTAFLAVFD